MATTVISYIVFDNTSRSPLGQVKMAGVTSESYGVPNRRVLGFYALVYVTGGKGYFRDDNGFACELQPGDALILFPEIGHSYGPLKNEFWDETWVVFEGEVFDLWQKGGLLKPEQPLHHLEPVEHWHKRITSAVWTQPKSGANFALERVCRFQQLLADIFLQEHQLEDEKTAWFSQATALLETSVETSPHFADLAASLDMSYESFRKRFTKEAGMSPGQYFIQQRMKRACELLVAQKVTIKEVSLELGFFDEFHFSKQFKKVMGMTPKEFCRLFR
jgi:AraC-like DNA-binding protein